MVFLPVSGVDCWQADAPASASISSTDNRTCFPFTLRFLSPSIQSRGLMITYYHYHNNVLLLSPANMVQQMTWQCHCISARMAITSWCRRYHMIRDTQQRDAIREALIDAGRPLSVDELFDSARSRVAGLGIATVYRTLKALQTEGQAVQVDLPGQPPRWEVTPSGHHHHFLCRTCDRVFEIYGCPEDVEQLLPTGYVLEKHDILLSGQCDACAGKANAPR